jgi:hypothetical protein
LAISPTAGAGGYSYMALSEPLMVKKLYRIGDIDTFLTVFKKFQ